MMKIRLTLHMLAAAICPAALFLGGCSKSEDKSMQDAKAVAANAAAEATANSQRYKLGETVETERPPT